MRRGWSRLICGGIRQTAQQHAHERWNFVNGHACGAHAHGVVPVRHNELPAISMPSHPQELAISPGVLHEDPSMRIRFHFSTHADSLLPPLHAVYRPTAEHRPSTTRHVLTWIARNTRARAPVTLAGGESAQENRSSRWAAQPLTGSRAAQDRAAAMFVDDLAGPINRSRSPGAAPSRR